MHYVLNGGDCYVEKGIREGRFGKTWYCQLWLICRHSYWQEDELKVSLKTDIPVMVVIPVLAMWRQRIISSRLALVAICNFCTRGLDDF